MTSRIAATTSPRLPTVNMASRHPIWLPSQYMQNGIHFDPSEVSEAETATDSPAADEVYDEPEEEEAARAAARPKKAKKKMAFDDFESFRAQRSRR